MTAIPLPGDRSAHDVDNYPARHASDLEANAPKYHTPLPGDTGNVLQSDGTKWVSQSLAAALPPIMTLGTFEGELSVQVSPFLFYNKYGISRTIVEVFLSVSDAPLGDDIIVDVLIDGSSIFLTGDRPKILDGDTVGSSIAIEFPEWADGSYLTWEVAQIGSSNAGANLVVHVVHGAGSYGSGS